MQYQILAYQNENGQTSAILEFRSSKGADLALIALKNYVEGREEMESEVNAWYVVAHYLTFNVDSQAVADDFLRFLEKAKRMK